MTNLLNSPQNPKKPTVWRLITSIISHSAQKVKHNLNSLQTPSKIPQSSPKPLCALPGFTIIEFLLSSTFVGLLLVAIALMTSHIIATYQKGLSIKAVNSVGRHIIDDFSRSIAAAPTKTTEAICRDKYTNTGFDVQNNTAYAKCKQDHAYLLTFHQNYGQVLNKATNQSQTLPLSGVFCNGRYSYLWNSGVFFSEHYDVSTTHKKITLAGFNDSSGSPKTFRLLRVPDAKRNICATHIDPSTYDFKPVTEYKLGSQNSATHHKDKIENLAKSQLAQATELLSDSDESLAIYDLRIFRPAIQKTTRQVLYSGTFILASARGSLDITGVGNYCQQPATNFATDFAYCSINKFNFAARALGKLSSDEQLERNLYENLK